MTPLEKLNEELLIVSSRRHAMWMPVFFGSFLVYCVPGYFVMHSAGGAELLASICAIGAMILALFTSPVVDAIYYEVRSRPIYRRYWEARAKEEVNG